MCFHLVLLRNSVLAVPISRVYARSLRGPRRKLRSVGLLLGSGLLIFMKLCLGYVLSWIAWEIGLW